MSACGNVSDGIVCDRRRGNHEKCRGIDPRTDDYEEFDNPDYRVPRDTDALTAKTSIASAAAATAPDVRTGPVSADSEPSGGPWSDAEREVVRRAVRTVCQRHAGGGEFTSDAIWAELGASVRMTHGLTALLQRARRDGWMDSTGKKARSARPREDHDEGRELTVWFSLLDKIADRSH